MFGGGGWWCVPLRCRAGRHITLVSSWKELKWWLRNLSGRFQGPLSSAQFPLNVSAAAGCDVHVYQNEKVTIYLDIELTVHSISQFTPPPTAHFNYVDGCCRLDVARHSCIPHRSIHWTSILSILFWQKNFILCVNFTKCHFKIFKELEAAILFQTWSWCGTWTKKKVYQSVH